MDDLSQDLPDSFVGLISSYIPSALHLMCHFTNDSRVAHQSPTWLLPVGRGGLSTGTDWSSGQDPQGWELGLQLSCGILSREPLTCSCLFSACDVHSWMTRYLFTCATLSAGCQGHQGW